MGCQPVPRIDCLPVRGKGLGALRGWVKKGHLGVGLSFAEDEVADEIAGIVGGDKGAFLVAYSWHMIRFYLANILPFFARLY